MKDTTDVLIVSIIIIAIVTAVVAMFFANNNWNNCENRGGTVVKTPSGYICAKIERV